MNRIDLTIGAQVICTDGSCGTLSKIALKPETWQVTHLVVEEGFLLKRARVFPFAALAGATPSEIRLDVQASCLEDYPLYQMHTMQMPASAPSEGSGSALWRAGVPYGVGAPMPAPVVTERVHRGVPAEMVVVDGHTSVEGSDGEIGKLDRFVVDTDTGVITEFIARQGALLVTDRTFPATMARAIAERAIMLSATTEALDDLPQDEAGLTRSASSAIGAVGESEVRADEARGGTMELTTKVAKALNEDPRTQDAVIEVIDENGLVTLDGEVDSVETREAAKEIAAAQPGVTAVVDLLRIAQ